PVMQLDAVVLPAPFGPISPTISHSFTARLRLSIAVRPPKRMVRSCTSSTDTAATAPERSTGRVAFCVVQRERLAAEPAGERPQHLTEPARVEDDGLQQQHRTDEVLDGRFVVGVPVEPTGVMRDAGEQ